MSQVKTDALSSSQPGTFQSRQTRIFHHKKQYETVSLYHDLKKMKTCNDSPSPLACDDPAHPILVHYTVRNSPQIPEKITNKS